MRQAPERDGLTGLPTREALLRALDRAVEAAADDGTQVALLLVDVDHLGRINETLGRRAGDDLLVTIAGHLRSWVRGTDTVARTGDDEFAVVMPGLTRPETLTSRVDEMIENLLTIVTAGGRSCTATVSIGGALYDPATTDASDLVPHARSALEHAKMDGRNNFQWYDA